MENLGLTVHEAMLYALIKDTPEWSKSGLLSMTERLGFNLEKTGELLAKLQEKAFIYVDLMASEGGKVILDINPDPHELPIFLPQRL